MKVCKFGGTSMANANTISRVVKIIENDSDRKIIVVSAPGKRDKADIKITDVLYQCYDEVEKTGKCDKSFKIIVDRFNTIISELKIKLDITDLLKKMKSEFEKEKSKDYIASRGEYLSALILAEKLGYEFIDATELIKFNDDEELQLEYSYDLISQKLKKVKKAVIPGFYGATPSGKVKTFSRGGSDITGAIVARAVSVSIYENWTDVNGFLSADPRIVDDPKLISYLSYKELRELAYMGAEVLHPESVFPVRSIGIPINIKNTFNETHQGTMIVAAKDLPKQDNVITGISGRKGFTIINIEKDMMNAEIGFARRVLSVLEEEHISFEHMPSGIDTLSIVIRDEHIVNKMQKVISKINGITNADNIDIHSGLSLIATVGHNMASRQGTAAKIFEALASKNINVRMIDQGSSELNIIVGVDTFDYEKAICSIYDAFN